MTNDEKFAADLSAITGKRIDVPKAETDEFSTSGFETREEKHQKDSLNALERLLFAHGDEAHTQGNGYDRARRALVEAIDEWNRLQPLLALPRLEDD